MASIFYFNFPWNAWPNIRFLFVSDMFLRHLLRSTNPVVVGQLANPSLLSKYFSFLPLSRQLSILDTSQQLLRHFADKPKGFEKFFPDKNKSEKSPENADQAEPKKEEPKKIPRPQNWSSSNPKIKTGASGGGNGGGGGGFNDMSDDDKKKLMGALSMAMGLGFVFYGELMDQIYSRVVWERSLTNEATWNSPPPWKPSSDASSV